MRNKVEAVDSSQDKEVSRTILECINRGWSFIPVYASTKKPSLSSWKKYQYQLPSNTDSINWTRSDGVAVVTGKLSGVIVLDVDVGGSESLKGKHLPITPCVRTPSGGWHYYFKHPRKKVTTKSNILPNVDVRGDGGYALIPGSPNYEWVEGLCFDDVPLAEAPEWIMNLCSSNRRGVSSNEYSLLDTPLKREESKISPIENFNKNHLKEWYRQEQVALSFLELLKINKKIGQSFKCVLPGHDDCKPSASIYRGENGTYIYRDWHGGNGEQILMLPEVYASFFYKKIVTMTRDKFLTEKQIGKSEFATWGIRLLVDMGFIEPCPIEMKPLSKGMKPSVVKVYKGFALLLGCKWLYSPGEPTPFSWRFASAWCGVSYRKVGEAIQILMKEGYIEIVGETTGVGRKMNLFKPKESDAL